MAFSFGKPASTPPFSFGTPAASTSTPPAASSPFSFGQPAAAQQQPAATSSPFTFGASTTSQAAPSTGLFGSPAPTTSTPSFSFGATPAAAPTTSLFGSGTGLFGSQQQQPASSATSTPGAFGSNLFVQSQTQQPASTSLFGSQPASTGLFGAPAASPPLQPQQALNKTSKFEELPDQIKKYLQEFQANLDAKKSIAEEMKARKLTESVLKTSQSIHDTRIDFNALAGTLESAKRSTDDLRRRFEVDLDDLCRAVKIVDNFKGSQSAPVVNTTTKGVVDSAFPFKYFKRNAEEMAIKVQIFQDTIDQIQSQLTHHDPDQVKAIVPTLKAQHALTLSLAANIAGVHEDLEEMKQVYVRLWREKTGNGVRDPFLEAGIMPAGQVQTAAGLQQLRIA